MRSGERGFTILELLVAMGLLAAFLVGLLQLLASGVELFDEGERGQDLADRTQAVVRAYESELGNLAGPSVTVATGAPDARLLVQWAPLGFRDDGTAPLVQVLRATVHLDEIAEERLLRRALQAEAERSARTHSPEDVEARLAELVAAAPRYRRGSMLLLPWPADPDGARLELRRGLFLAGQRIPIRRGVERDLFELRELGGPDFPPQLIHEVTEVVATDILHVLVRCWSQQTRSLDGTPGRDGPELAWDSARAGWASASDEPARRFSLDLGPDSLAVPSDDVHPRWICVDLTVGGGEPVTVLTAELGPKEPEARFGRPDALASGDFVKIGPEWLRLGAQQGFRFDVARAQRRTFAGAHPRGAAVHAGRSTRVLIRVPHGKDSLDG